jgi:hypothetical protein
MKGIVPASKHESSAGRFRLSQRNKKEKIMGANLCEIPGGAAGSCPESKRRIMCSYPHSDVEQWSLKEESGWGIREHLSLR